MTKVHKGRIGVFDSGFGGLSILKEIVKELPDYDYVYLGDTARAPYGTRSAEVVHKFTVQAIDFLFAHGCELVVIACNTASAEAVSKIQQDYLTHWYKNRRVLGVVVPAVEEAVAQTKTKRVGVLATHGTVRSRKFSKELKKLDKRVRIFEQSAPLLVPLIEEGAHRSKAAGLLLKEYLAPLKKARIDTLILGCTHYGHMEAAIRRGMGKGVNVISEGRVVGKKLAEYLSRHPEIDKRLARTKKMAFYSTDLTDRFRTMGSMFFGKPVKPVKATLE